MKNINVERLMRNVAIGSTIVILLSQIGCTTTANRVVGPDVQISMTAEGTRAWGDYQNGLVKTGKEAPDSPNQHLVFRAKEEQEITKRKNAPGFLAELFESPGSATHDSATSDN